MPGLGAISVSSVRWFLPARRYPPQTASDPVHTRPGGGPIPDRDVDQEQLEQAAEDFKTWLRDQLRPKFSWLAPWTWRRYHRDLSIRPPLPRTPDRWDTPGRGDVLGRARPTLLCNTGSPMAFEAPIPETRFVALDGDRIACQVFGNGDVDLICVAAIGECLDLNWDWPPYAAFLRRLAKQARVIIFDVRGSGSSDSPSGETLPSWEQWADEAKAVLDELDSRRAVVLGTADGGPTAALFAASHPTRSRGLILINSSACFPEITDGLGVSQNEASKIVQDAWGTEVLADLITPDAARDPDFRRWFARSLRLSLTPREAEKLLGVISTMDVRSVLESVRVPTLVLHREAYQAIPLSHGQYLADHIPDAKLAVLPGRDSVIYTEPAEEGLQAIEQFLTDLHAPSQPDRALAAILFTDIVSSTEQLSTLGDREWRNLLDSHDVLAKTVVEQNGGRLVYDSEATGDGILATFDGPGRAIRCATALNEALRPLGVAIRAGLHTGEVEMRDTGIAGIGVHIAARVLAMAEAGEILVSAAVPMLVAGSGYEFEDRGEHQLKGVPGMWRLFTVKD